MAKTVGIIGAGPSGLVAAKSFLHDAPPGSFRVTIYDAQPRIGGLWPLRKDDSDGLLHPLMIANQSKHTVQFSDLAWEPKYPELPRAWQVGKYLERYQARYCKDADLQLSTRVETAELALPDPENGISAPRWRLRVRSGDGRLDERQFDYLVVASGFFGRPVVPPSLSSSTNVPVIHSSAYRDLKALLGHTSGEGRGRKILVVGGQMSGVEIAGTIGFHLSSVTNSPGPSPIVNPEKYSIHHIVQRPVWILPLYTSPKPTSKAPPFLPLDLPFYNLSNRPPALTNSQGGHISAEAARITHSMYRAVLGTDQSEFSSVLSINGRKQDDPPYLAVSDNYMDFVRSGLIKVSYGKLSSLEEGAAVISPSDEKVSDIAAVVLATGFEAASSLSFFPASIQQTLSVDPTDLNNTIALSFHSTHHPALPHLGFVGFYRSPYWGVMEMQSRFLTTLWSSSRVPQTLLSALQTDRSIERTLLLRGDRRAPQFPMGDYAFLMQEFASALGLTRLPPFGTTPPLPPPGMPMDILTPARYPSARISPEQEAALDDALRQTHETALAGLTKGKYVAYAVFRSLLGEWKLERDLVSQLPSHPSGRFTGTAKFLLREGTADGREVMFERQAREEDFDPGMEYLYVEEGDFRATNGMSFRATRRYVWRYDEDKDKLSVWFVRTDDQKRADYLFHEIAFVVPPDEAAVGGDEKGWEAKAGHLCVDDFYDVKYEFRFEAVNLADWRISYSVKGPKKDYSIDGRYTR